MDEGMKIMKMRFTRHYTTSGGRKFQGLFPHIQSDSVHWSSIDDAFRVFDAASLGAMLSAAYDSPDFGVQRPALLVLWYRAMINPPHGQVSSSFGDLPVLLSTVHKAIPQLRVFEDYEPADPRLPVHVAVNGGRYRIHPGNLTNAVALIGVVQTTAHAIDSFILETKGFAATDLLEAALSYCDWRLTQLEKVWPLRNATHDRIQRPGIKEIETVRVIHQAAPTEWLNRCAYPERAAVAWGWVSQKATSVRFDMQPMAQSMGPVLAVDSCLGVIPIPAAEVLNAVGIAMAHLALEVRDVREAQRSIQIETEEFVRRVLNMPVCDHDGAVVTVVAPGTRHVFAMGIVAALDPDALSRAVHAVTDGLMEFDASAIEDGRLDPSASVYRILLYGGPFRLSRWRNGSIIQASVYDFVAIVRDVQQLGRNYDLLWEFLMAITDHEKKAGFMAVCLLDAWHHWLEFGVLNPVYWETALLVSPTDHQQWMRAVAWDPIEETLYKALFPPIREWAWTHLDDPERATLVDPLGTPVMIATNPSIVVVVPQHKLVGWEDLDPAFCTGVSEGILATCIRHSRIAQILRESSTDPVIIVVEFVDDEQATQHPGSVGVAVDRNQPRSMIVLRLSSSWIKELIRNPKTAHAAVGQALFAGLDLISSVDLNIVQQPFLEAWNESPPIAMMGLQESTLNSSSQGVESLPDMISAVNHMLAQELAIAGIQSGTYHGAAMVDIARMVLTILASRIQALLTNWSMYAIDVVAKYLNAAHGERMRARQQLGAALRAPWSEVWRQEALRNPQGPEITRPLEVLLEYLVARETCGVMRPDRFDVGYGRAVFNWFLKIGTILSSADQGLTEWIINVTP